jgi:hypothetical protein
MITICAPVTQADTKITLYVLPAPIRIPLIAVLSGVGKYTVKTVAEIITGISDIAIQEQVAVSYHSAPTTLALLV